MATKTSSSSSFGSLLSFPLHKNYAKEFSIILVSSNSLTHIAVCKLFIWRSLMSPVAKSSDWFPPYFLDQTAALNSQVLFPVHLIHRLHLAPGGCPHLFLWNSYSVCFSFLTSLTLNVGSVLVSVLLGPSFFYLY